MCRILIIRIKAEAFAREEDCQATKFRAGSEQALNSKVKDISFALYRDFPDSGRVRGQEKFKKGMLATCSMLRPEWLGLKCLTLV